MNREIADFEPLANTLKSSNQVRQMKSTGVIPIVCLTALFSAVASGDEFGDECLAAIGDASCRPFVGCVRGDCDAFSVEPILRSDERECFSATPQCTNAGPRPVALQCCPLVSAGCEVQSEQKSSMLRAWRENRPGLRCRLEEQFVNWRMGSVSLTGCMPEGYSLSCFVESVPSVEFHSAPLSDCPLAAEPANARELIEGPEKPALHQISLDITPPVGQLPDDRAEVQFAQLDRQPHQPGTTRPWCATTEYWQASLLNHQPLYFEDVNLERHGFSHGCLQPLISGGKFFTTIAILPYLMGSQPAHGTQYTLGETRSGNPACYVCQRPPLSLRGAAFEGAAITGLIFLIP